MADDHHASDSAVAQSERARSDTPRATRVRLVYIAGSYRAKTPWEVEQNVRRAEALAYDVAQLGAYPICPHTNTRPLFAGAQPDDFWLAGTLELMRRCDAVVCVPGWATSIGTRAERAEAERLGIPVFEAGAAIAAWVREARHAAE